MNLMGRIWDMIWSAFNTRITTQQIFIVDWFDTAQKHLIETTTDITQMQSVQLVVHGMTVVGLILLAFCLVVSLSELSTSAMLGGNFTPANWLWRLLVASTMTVGSLPVYGRMIATTNYLTDTFRKYLEDHQMVSSFKLYQAILSLLTHQNMFVILFILVFVVFLIILWFLMGGVRPAELAIFTLLAPLTWPLYMIPSLDDVPKTAFRGFIGLQLMQLIVVGIMRLATRWMAEQDFVNPVLRVVPATGLIIMAVFVPAVIKRIVGQGHTGVSALSTAVRVAMAFKGLQLLRYGGGGGATGLAAAPSSGTAPAPAGGVNPYPPATVGPTTVSAMAPASGYGGSYQQASVSLMPPPPPPARFALTDGGTGYTIRGTGMAHVDGQPVTCEVLSEIKTDAQELKRAAEAHIPTRVIDVPPPSRSGHFYGGGSKEE